VRKPPGYAFIDFDDHRNAQDAILDLNYKYNWRVELSHYYRGGGDRSGREHGSGELDSGSSRCCSQLILVFAGVQVSIPIYHSSCKMYSYILS